MHPIMQLTAGMDTQAALDRMKTQGQDFTRAYAEFVFFRDFALSNPMTAQKWIALNRVSLATQKVVSGVNSNIDAVNSISRMMFGNGVLDMLPDISNLYLMSGNGALAYVIQELRKFNVAMGRLAISAQENQNDETKPNPQ